MYVLLLLSLLFWELADKALSLLLRPGRNKTEAGPLLLSADAAVAVCCGPGRVLLFAVSRPGFTSQPELRVLRLQMSFSARVETAKCCGGRAPLELAAAFIWALSSDRDGAVRFAA